MDEEGWTEAIRLGDVTDRRPVKVSLEEEDILVVRDGDRLFAIGNRCTHQGAPLSKGPVRFGGSLATVQCAAHGSMFNLVDGKVLRGPAMTPVHAYDARVNGDMIEVCRRD